MAEHDEGLVFDAKNQTLKEFLSKWLSNSVQHSVRQRTYERYEQLVRDHINPALGRMKLKSLTPAHLQGLYREKLDSGLSPRTVRYIHATVHKALKQAVKWGLIPHNIVEAVDPPRLLKKEMQPLTPGQAKRFLKAVTGDRHEALYVLAISAGLRQGELLGLKWGDIDLVYHSLQVQRTLSMTKKGVTFVPPKSAKGRRNLTLTTRAAKALIKHRMAQEEEGQKLGNLWEDHGLVFPNQSGKPLHPWIVTKRFKKVLKESNLPEVRFHDLRHTALRYCYRKPFILRSCRRSWGIRPYL
jgi:integrase